MLQQKLKGTYPQCQCGLVAMRRIGIYPSPKLSSSLADLYGRFPEWCVSTPGVVAMRQVSLFKRNVNGLKRSCLARFSHLHSVAPSATVRQAAAGCMSGVLTREKWLCTLFTLPLIFKKLADPHWQPTAAHRPIRDSCVERWDSPWTSVLGCINLAMQEWTLRTTGFTQQVPLVTQIWGESLVALQDH